MKRKSYLVITIFILSYLLSHLFRLVSLPVFADESIYIRWAQLIIDDSARYLFFPLNDGKTPLFIWTMVPALKIFTDPLFAGRSISVLMGLIQVGFMYLLTKTLSQDRLSAILAVALTSWLPFWFFHQRMALMDGMLATLLTICLYLAVLLVQEQSRSFFSSRKFLLTFLISLTFGMAFWTKLPAVLFSPTLILVSLLSTKPQDLIALKSVKDRLPTMIWLLAGVIGGVAIFYLLRFQPAFPQIFGRGGDFLYSLPEFLAEGYKSFLSNQRDYFQAFIYYLTPLGFVLPLVGLLFRRKRLHFWLILMALSFYLPIALLGKVVYSRYFLPMAIPLTISASLVLSDFIKFVLSKKELKKRIIWASALTLVIVNIVGPSSQFIFYSWFNPDRLLLTDDDKTQYLTDWSSGHGIVEVVAMIEKESTDHTLAVATEGFFGTLPDAINMYLHGKDVSNIWVEGIGQPVREIRTDFTQKAKSYERQWLVVNSHRLLMKIDKKHKIAEFCRPFNAPCLQVWDITGLI